MELTIDDLMQELKELREEVSQLGFNTKRVFKPVEAAEFLGIGYDTIMREARLGRIGHVMNGRIKLFKLEHLEEWLDKNERKVK